MAKVVICPSCQYQGSIPDEANPKRIRCPKCKEVFDVKGAVPSGSQPAKRPVAAKQPQATLDAVFDDDDDAKALHTPAKPVKRPAAAKRPQPALDAVFDDDDDDVESLQTLTNAASLRRRHRAFRRRLGPIATGLCGDRCRWACRVVALRCLGSDAHKRRRRTAQQGQSSNERGL